MVIGTITFLAIDHGLVKISYVRLQYTCSDAAGQNMVTIATHRAFQDFLQSNSSKHLGIVDFQVEGQFSFVKKLSWGNVKEPRGIEVMAWGTLSDSRVQYDQTALCDFQISRRQHSEWSDGA